MRKQCAPGALSPPSSTPGNEASVRWDARTLLAPQVVEHNHVNAWQTKYQWKVGHMIGKNSSCLLLLAVSVVWQCCWGNKGFSVVWQRVMSSDQFVWACVDLCVGSYWSMSNLLGCACLFNLRLTPFSGHLLLGNTGQLCTSNIIWHSFGILVVFNLELTPLVTCQLLGNTVVNYTCRKQLATGYRCDINICD